MENKKNEIKYGFYPKDENTKLKINLQKIFDENDFKEINDIQNSNLILPKDYTNIEKYLNNIDITDKNKEYYIYGVNGGNKMAKKEELYINIKNSIGESIHNFIPSTYLLKNSNDINKVKEKLELGKVFILKKNIQRREGLNLISSIKELEESITHNNSTNLPNDKYVIAQEFLNDTYLINDRKLSLRIYLLIVINNDKIDFYLHNLGRCHYANEKYTGNVFDSTSNFSSTSRDADLDIYKESPRTIDELKEFLKNKDGVDSAEKLFSNIDNIIFQLKSTYSTIFTKFDNLNYKNITNFQLFGIDVIFDNDLNAFLLEANKGPLMSHNDELNAKISIKVESDVFKLVGLINPNDTNGFIKI
jgi:hypothetical protein